MATVGLTRPLDVVPGGPVAQLAQAQDDVMVLVLPLGGVQQQGVQLLIAAVGRVLPVLKRLLPPLP